MANFNTHITVAAVGSGLLSTLCLQVGFIGTSDALLLTLAGTIGGILPDIDLQHSYPSRIIFSLLGMIISFLWIFSTQNQLSIVELWVIGLIIFAVIRYPIWMIFHKYTKHRGAIHSLVAAFAFALFTTSISFHFFAKTDFISWLIGLLVFYGFIIHLILDELYSVDFMNHRIKRSFGTAMKIMDTKQRMISSILIALASISFWFSPDSTAFLDTLSSPQTYQIIWHRMLPENLITLLK
ncbi:MAG: hydrolase [Aquificaceae bacterium]|nr:MAG: hydrolase [Aquificaceae bacterium]